MGILLIDSSTKKIEFGYADENELIIKEVLDSDHNADTLTYFIKKAFEGKKIDFGKIEYVSLSNGPGSFTGLRISSAIAKGICFALESKLIEISSLDIIANKSASEFPGEKITSLIFANTKTIEFYYAVYESESGELKKISDYKVDSIDNILTEDIRFVINENLNESIKQKFLRAPADVSHLSNLESQYSIAKRYIHEKHFADYRTSQPFYMKEFIPKI